MNLAEPTGCGAPGRTGMAGAVMAEVAERLESLAGAGEPGAIDLRSLPLTPADLEELDERLGRGEVTADLTVAGRSEAWETAWSGVWRVRHYGAAGALATNEIRIAAVPDIIPSHPDDISEAAARLRAAVVADASTADREEAIDG